MSSGAEQWRGVHSCHERARPGSQPARRAPAPGPLAPGDGPAPRDQRQRPVPDRDRQGPPVGGQAVRHRQPARTCRSTGCWPATGRPPGATQGFVSLQRAGEHETLELEAGVRWRRLTAGSYPGVEFLHVEYQPGGSSSGDGTSMRHAGQEFGYVLSGRLTIRVGFDTHELGPGDSISFPGDHPAPAQQRRPRAGPGRLVHPRPACQCLAALDGSSRGMAMGIRTYGPNAVDWEERVDFDRLRTERLARLKAALDRSELGALLSLRLPQHPLHDRRPTSAPGRWTS